MLASWRKLLLIFLILLSATLVMLPATTIASATDKEGKEGWTEEKVGKLAVKADKAALSHNWTKAIRYGEQMLEGATALYVETDLGYLNRLKTLNRYYDKADRLAEVGPRVTRAYELSKAQLGPEHYISEVSRLLYYKLLVADKEYSRAAAVVEENIDLLGSSEDDRFRKLDYLKQLFSLYGLSGQAAEEARTIEAYLTLEAELEVLELEESLPVIINLAKNYCARKMFPEFQGLMQRFALDYVCER